MKLSDKVLSIDTHFIDSLSGNSNFVAQSRARLETISRRVAKNRINGLGIPFPPETMDALVEMLVQMNLMHVRGDETPDEEMNNAIKNLSDLLGSEETESDFPLDFPPADNKLEIHLGAAISK